VPCVPPPPSPSSLCRRLMQLCRSLNRCRLSHKSSARSSHRQFNYFAIDVSTFSPAQTIEYRRFNSVIQFARLSVSAMTYNDRRVVHCWLDVTGGTLSVDTSLMVTQPTLLLLLLLLQRDGSNYNSMARHRRRRQDPPLAFYIFLVGRVAFAMHSTKCTYCYRLDTCMACRSACLFVTTVRREPCKND